MIKCPRGHENPDGVTYCQEPACHLYIDSSEQHPEPEPFSMKFLSVSLSTTTPVVTAGTEGSVQVAIANAGDVAGSATVAARGPAWISVAPAELTVEPGAKAHAELRFAPPATIEVLETVPFEVEVTAPADPADTIAADGVLTVEPAPVAPPKEPEPPTPPFPWRPVLIGLVAIALLGGGIALVVSLLGPDTPPVQARPYAEEVAQDRPLAYWRFNEADNDQPAADASGNGLDGVYRGNLQVGIGGALSEQANTAATLDGFNDWVQIGGAGMKAFHPGEDFSVEAWVYLTGTINVADAIVGPAAPKTGDSINFRGKRLRLHDRETKTDKIIAVSEIVPSRWTHWVVTRHGAELRIYKDGALDAATATTPFTFWPRAIGHWDGTKHFLRGQLDEIAIYDYALSEERIRAHVLAR